MSLVRWLTTAARLRLWVSQERSNNKLKITVTYIMKVYVSTWFRIKNFNYCIDGPENLLHMIQQSRYMPPTLRTLFDETIQNNSYFAHPENILLAMLADERKSIRQKAYDKIVEVRENHPVSRNGIRKFIKPNINFDASSYELLINWDDSDTEPPLTILLSAEQLLYYVNNHDPRNKIFRFPYHTQAVERGVKKVTETSKHVCDEAAKDKYIRTTLQRRKIMPKFNTKAEFKM
ncbi:hypothetical protein TSAR_007981 [Trichomalopsis sarcophagae]|uniref:Uncharacterized protein n=1 Tax=Trichomalopsis sarcophagae TaxID=543379 RepID=A0A232FP99_9HYME|nr:hypothetical protein TSAR_007981 [Trichomalopsis sarcophagae]